MGVDWKVGTGVGAGIGVGGIAAIVASMPACIVASMSGVGLGVAVGRACATAVFTAALTSSVGGGESPDPEHAASAMVRTKRPKTNRALFNSMGFPYSTSRTLCPIAAQPLITYSVQSIPTTLT